MIIKSLMQLLQILRLFFIFTRYSLSEIFLGKHKLLWLNPWYLCSTHKLSRGARLRLALQQAGPIFIKFGQLLSIRYDALPSDILAELAKLRDQVSAIHTKKIIKILETSFDKKLSEVFQTFEQKPLAAASIAQVHAAVLLNGDAVAVKIVKPNIKKQIARDIKLLEFCARLIEKVLAPKKNLKPTALVNEIKNSLFKELDLQNEANNASKLKAYANTIEQCYIPKIYWDYCFTNIIVMEQLTGVPMYNTQKLLDYGINTNKLARTCISVFFTQIFRDRFFHADLHPGNIFIDIRNPSYPTIELVDFGIIGTLSPSDQKYIAENILAVTNRDYLKFAKLHQESGWIPQNIPVEAFANAMQKVCDPILNKPLKEISFGELLRGLISVAKRYRIAIQPQLLLLQKTLVNIEGLCRQLDPDINLWDVAKPIVEHWIREQVGPRAFFKKLKQQLPMIMHRAPELPDIMNQAMQLLEQKQAVTQNINTPSSINTQYNDQSSRYALATKLLLICLTILLLLQFNLLFMPVWLSNSLLILLIILLVIS